MGWIAWFVFALSLFAAGLLLAAFLFRFRFSCEYAFPASTAAEISLSFLMFKKTLRISEEEKGDAADMDENDSGKFSPAPGQQGFLRVPFQTRILRFRRHLVAASRKWIMDPKVWLLFLRYLVQRGFRLLGLLRFHVGALHVGSSHVMGLTRFAALWSSLGGVFPALMKGEVSYGYMEKPFSFKIRVAGGSNGLTALGYLAALFFTFPWRAMFRRFRLSWRFPRLNRWQRRLLLS